MIQNLSREILHERHRLSHHQIDDLLGEHSGKKYIGEKLDQLSKLATFLELTDELKAHNLWFVVLKGPILSQRIYNDPACRRWRDFDLLTEPAYIPRFIEVLNSLGFEIDSSLWPESEKRQDLVLYFGKNLEFYHPQKGCTVEIHWKLFTDRLTNPGIEWNLIKSNIEPVEFSGKSFNRLNHEFELLYLVIHGSLHAWFRLKWLVDIRDMLSRVNIQPERFLELTEWMNAERFVCVCNFVLKTCFPGSRLLPFGTDDCSSTGNYALEKIREEAVQPKMSFTETLRAIRYKMSLSPKLRYKLDVLRLITFNKQDLKYKWIPPFPFFFFLFRPAGLFIRKLK